MASPASKLRIFVDADVLFAGAASPGTQGASHILLVLGELTLVECLTSVQAVTEVERNLTAKLPAKLPEFQLLVNRALHILPDPEPAALPLCVGQADPKDLPLLVAALQADCPYFVTFNTRHFYPPETSITILRPGELLLTIRQTLSYL